MASANPLPRKAVDRSGRPDRAQLILLAAERLFAQRGYPAVTIQQIAKEAGVPTGLVSYYHGPKHELFHAIFSQWSGTTKERIRLLAEARATATEPGVLRRVVQAFVVPVLQLRSTAEGEYYSQLVARELVYRTPEAERALSEYFDPLAHAFIDGLQAVSPGSSRSDAAWAYQFAVGALLHHISDKRVEHLSLGQNRAVDPSARLRLVRFITSGIEAVLADAGDDENANGNDYANSKVKADASVATSLSQRRVRKVSTQKKQLT